MLSFVLKESALCEIKIIIHVFAHDNRKGIKVLPLVALIVDYQWMCMYRILFSYHGIC